mmetsp:Transcript_37332/g.76552  ORF Transcript_37332/g.76552 Transcript_37332/m.76552 type:complete len:152 (-) Transcript_37332:852-1307(-)
MDLGMPAGGAQTREEGVHTEAPREGPTSAAVPRKKPLDKRHTKLKECDQRTSGRGLASRHHGTGVPESGSGHVSKSRRFEAGGRGGAAGIAVIASTLPRQSHAHRDERARMDVRMLSEGRAGVQAQSSPSGSSSCLSTSSVEVTSATAIPR